MLDIRDAKYAKKSPFAFGTRHIVKSMLALQKYWAPATSKKKFCIKSEGTIGTV